MRTAFAPPLRRAKRATTTGGRGRGLASEVLQENDPCGGGDQWAELPYTESGELLLISGELFFTGTKIGVGVANQRCGGWQT